MIRIGMYNRWLKTLGGGERYSLAIAEYLSKTCDVEVISHELLDMRVASQRLGLALGNVRLKVIPAASDLTALSGQYDLFINASHWNFFPSIASKSALIVFFPFHLGNPLLAQIRYLIGRSLNSFPLNSLIRVLLTKRFSDLQTRLDNLVPPNFLMAVDSYTQLWSISHFSQEWTQTYWRRPSHLLYPFVTIEQIQPRPKQQLILNVGRFFAGNHNKKHLVMIDSFKQMLNHGLQGWELHLAGGSMSGFAHEEYLSQIRKASENLPIYLHVDLDRAALIELYGKSAIYWHASGYGEDESREPHKFEHFGITTVEAMAAGCVPIVIGRGGQPELVDHNVNGLLWQSLPELVSLSTELMRDQARMEQLSKASIARSRQFGQSIFENRLYELLLQMNVNLS